MSGVFSYICSFLFKGNDGFPYFAQLPEDIQALIFDYAADMPKAFLTLTKVCKRWAALCQRITPAKRKTFLRPVKLVLGEEAFALPNGVLEGPCVRWLNGQKISETHYVNGEQHGISQTWYHNGQLHVRDHISHGNSHGPHEVWFADGRPYLRVQYKNRQRHGLQEVWYNNGNKQYETMFEEGERQGLCKIWHKNGQMAAIQMYEKNKLLLQRKWDEEGIPIL